MIISLYPAATQDFGLFRFAGCPSEAENAVLDGGVGGEARSAVPVLDVFELGPDGFGEQVAVR
jgi:hypothetical protein